MPPAGSYFVSTVATSLNHLFSVLNSPFILLQPMYVKNAKPMFSTQINDKNMLAVTGMRILP